MAAIYSETGQYLGEGPDYVYDPFSGVPLSDPGGVMSNPRQGGDSSGNSYSTTYGTGPADAATIIGNNAANTAESIGEAINDFGAGVVRTAGNILDGATSIGKIAVIGLVAWAVIEVLSKIPDQNNAKRRIGQYARRKARNAVRRIGV